jgi:hypothetical protein
LGWLVPAHAFSAWLSTAALVLFAALLAARRLTRTNLSVWAAAAVTLLLSLSGALGAMLHLPYRLQLRQRIFLHSRELGWLFERKQHLAFGALLLAWSGLCALLAGRLALASKHSAAQARGRELYRAAAVAYIASALFAAVASVASAVVSAREHF